MLSKIVDLITTPEAVQRSGYDSVTMELTAVVDGLTSLELNFYTLESDHTAYTIMVHDISDTAMLREALTLLEVMTRCRT